MTDIQIVFLLLFSAPALLPERLLPPDHQCGYLSDTRYIDLMNCRRNDKAIGAMCSKSKSFSLYIHTFIWTVPDHKQS